MSAPVLLWLRRDLRLSDHPALTEACRRGPVIPVFILDPEGDGAWPPGGASRWWLHHSLLSLAEALARRGSRLIFRRGSPGGILRGMAQETGAAAVHFSRRYEPAAARRDTDVTRELREAGVAAECFASALLREPETLRTGAGKPFQVFTPFWKAWLAAPPPLPPLPVPRRIPAPEAWPESLALEALGLLPANDWAGGLREAWHPGWEGAQDHLRGHLNDVLPGYPDARDLPAVDGTSRLSPHLHFGEIGIREVWEAAAGYPDADGPAVPAAPGGRGGSGGLRGGRGAEAWRRQIAWREFAHHLLAYFPRTAEDPLRPAFAEFPWRRDPAAFEAWTRGRTGYPLVDAGMRQLRHTGWMHNRVRMAAASFLVKHLLVPWQDGARWFWDTLVDADLAQNTLGWQWVAGCGADAAPYFRIFNPVAQGERFDPAGDYVRRWVPELAGLPPRFIHRPWEAPAEVLRHAGVEPGAAYPVPWIGHAEGRARALAAYASLRRMMPAAASTTRLSRESGKSRISRSMPFD